MEKTNQEKVAILVYGTLKEGCYNYNRIREAFGNDSLVKVGETNIEGYDMYDLKYYPAITPGNGAIQCEIMEASREASLFIKYMEIGAGYEEKITDQGRIYIQTEPIKGYRKIETGEWKEEYTV